MKGCSRSLISTPTHYELNNQSFAFPEESKVKMNINNLPSSWHKS